LRLDVSRTQMCDVKDRCKTFRRLPRTQVRGRAMTA
jgi:hypothetical protein